MYVSAMSGKNFATVSIVLSRRALILIFTPGNRMIYSYEGTNRIDAQRRCLLLRRVLRRRLLRKPVYADSLAVMHFRRVQVRPAI